MKGATRKTRDKLKKAERGNSTGAEEVGKIGTKDDDDPAVSVEQEASEGPEGRGPPG